MNVTSLRAGRFAASALFFACLAPAHADPAMTMPMGKTPPSGHLRAADTAMPGMAGMSQMKSQMNMSSSIDLNDPMSQEASGTAWLPASSPMYGKMTMRPNGDMLMVHGALMARYTDTGSKRGDRRFDAPNWIMAMYGHPLDAKSQIGFRGMFSLDPITEGGAGYPLLFQTGESWHHEALHDHQHPHDLVDELAVSYSRLIGGGKSVSLYGGYPGEPALGPPTYMHRLLAYDLADAPIGHHWQDATHITFGVATAGLNFGSKFKVEGSVFTGREPDENRYSFDKPRFDSQSARLSYNPNADNAFQVSHGFIKNAEGDGADQHRITASWLYNRPLSEDSNFTTALVWGQNNLTTEGKSNSYLAEADYQRGRDTVFTRIENIQKSGHELSLPEDSLQERKFTIGAYTAGYVRDLTHGTGIDTGLGLAVTANTYPSALNTDYGSGTPLSFQVYLRFRPSRSRNMSLGAKPTKNTGISITAALAPDPPQAGQDSTLTITVTRADGLPLPGATVTASVAMTTMDMGTTHPALTDSGTGRYTGPVQFSMAGPWRVTVSVTPPGGGPPTVQAFNYAVKPR